MKDSFPGRLGQKHECILYTGVHYTQQNMLHAVACQELCQACRIHRRIETSRSSQFNREGLYENQNFIAIGAKMEIHECEKLKASREDSI